jgi:Family of unknown function (DUF6283)
MIGVARAPCGSCPYRRDAPSGLWVKAEYDKLPGYDGETWQQPMAVFMCHQSDGNLCAGWLACHDPRELLALRFGQSRFAPRVFDYTTDVPLFGSGAEARAHGLKDHAKPGPKARRMMGKLLRRRQRKEEK